MRRSDPLADALGILADLDMPRGQRNERTALCLLALAGMTPSTRWRDATAPLMGITPIVAFCETHYGRHYAPNSREAFRRRSIHQLVQAGVVQRNPDDLERPVNSPHTVYQLTPEALVLLQSYGMDTWSARLAAFLEMQPALRTRYEWEREQARVPVTLPDGQRIALSPGDHSALMGAIIQLFCPRLVPGGRVIYVGVTGDRLGYYDRGLARELGLADDLVKFPDVIVYDARRRWLLLIEAVTSHGPVDPKRHIELVELFSGSGLPIVFVSAFESRATMARFVMQIAWETVVWVADAPSHLVHFDGDRFLEPSEPGQSPALPETE